MLSRGKGYNFEVILLRTDHDFKYCSAGMSFPMNSYFTNIIPVKKEPKQKNLTVSKCYKLNGLEIYPSVILSQLSAKT